MRRADIDNLGVAGPLHHDVRRLDVAVDDLLPMERGQPGQALANDRNRDARLQPSARLAGGRDHIIDVVPALLTDAGLGPPEHARREQRIEVVAVDPFHLEHADAAALDEVLHVEQIVVLDLGDLRADGGHPLHRLAVGPLIGKPLGRKELEGNRQREVVGSAALAEVDDPLPAAAEHPAQPQMLGPTQLLLLDELQVVVEQFIDPVLRPLAARHDSTRAVQEFGGHAHGVPRRGCSGVESANLPVYSNC